jgi:regulator of replication initiation timing
MNLTKQELEGVMNLAREAQELRNENARLKLAVKNLHTVLRDVSMNIDVSTINNSKRNTQRWGDLRVRAAEVLDITQGWTK